MLCIAFSCKNPDQVADEDMYCSAGTSVLTIDDSNVSTTVKNRIYRPASGSTILHSSHPDFNNAGRTIIIPIALTDVPFNTKVTNSVIDQVFFTTGVGSMKDYFYENSWGQFNMTKTAVSQLVTLNRTKASYVTGTTTDYTRNPLLFRDICQNSSINWGTIDRNNDRVITPDEALIVIIISDGGQGACRPNNFTITYNGQEYRIRNRFVTVDCLKASDPRDGIATFEYNYSTMWHELAHGFFGLPDRYGEFAGRGTGGLYDIMDGHYDRIHMTVVDKMKIGWIMPRVLLPAAQRMLTGLRCYSFAPIESQPSAVVLYSEDSPNECFVIENRTHSGSARNFNEDMPSEGLAIWWLDLNTGDVRLIDASVLGSGSRLRPMEYPIPTGNALFHYKEGDSPTVPKLLRNQNDRQTFTLRAISPAGTTMSVEL